MPALARLIAASAPLSYLGPVKETRRGWKGEWEGEPWETGRRCGRSEGEIDPAEPAIDAEKLAGQLERIAIALENAASTLESGASAS